MMEPWSEFKYINKILKEIKKDDTIKVININSNQVGNKGDNYLSVVKRLLVKYKRNENLIDVNDEIWLFTKIIQSSLQESSKKTVSPILI